MIASMSLCLLRPFPEPSSKTPSRNSRPATVRRRSARNRTNWRRDRRVGPARTDIDRRVGSNWRRRTPFDGWGGLLAVSDRRRRGGDRRFIDRDARKDDLKDAFERALFGAFDRAVERSAGDHAERAHGAGAGQRDRRFHHGRIAIGPDQIDVNLSVRMLSPQQRQPAPQLDRVTTAR